MTSAERYCNEEQNNKIMKSFLSIKPGATFFLGRSQTLVYHKDSIEISKNCPLKLWKDRLVAVWGEETK